MSSTQKQTFEPIPELFGSMVFNDKTMKERLPKETYRALKKTIELGKHLEPTIADVVANAMKDWAVEKGATHFTHWFQPMTVSLLKNTIVSFPLTAMARLLWNFAVKN